MDVQRKGLLTLIRSALTETALPLPESFDLAKAMAMIRKHGIETLIYDGAVRCGLDRQQPVMQELFRRYCLLLQQSERQLQAIDRLYTALDAAGVDYMPLKGCNMKHLYPKPELRLMGDADILVRTEQYDRIRPVVKGLGYEELVDSDHELIWHSPELHLELHKRLIPSYNKDYYAYFGDGWRLARQECGSRFAMTPEDTMVYQFTHFAKHYRDGGIGLRHAADLWVYLRRRHPEEAPVRRELERLHLLEFYDNIRRLLEHWFQDGPADEKTDVIADFLFSSGSWGSHENHVISDGVKKAHEAGSVTGGRLKRLMTSLFPNRLIMAQKYPVLQKCPVLLPVCWPVRWVTAVLFRRDNVKRQRQSLQTMSAQNIKTYQQAMRFVGLDFHFKE